MCSELLFVKVPRRYEEVKRRLICQLRIVRKHLPAIPSSSPQGTGGIRETIESKREALVGGGAQRDCVHHVGLGLVGLGVPTNTGSKTVDILQVRLHVRLPLPLLPARTALLDTNGGVDGEGHWAVNTRGINIIL